MVLANSTTSLTFAQSLVLSFFDFNILVHDAKIPFIVLTFSPFFKNTRYSIALCEF